MGPIGPAIYGPCWALYRAVYRALYPDRALFWAPYRLAVFFPLLAVTRWQLVKKPPKPHRQLWLQGPKRVPKDSKDSQELHVWRFRFEHPWSHYGKGPALGPQKENSAAHKGKIGPYTGLDIAPYRALWALSGGPYEAKTKIPPMPGGLGHHSGEASSIVFQKS